MRRSDGLFVGGSNVTTSAMARGRHVGASDVSFRLWSAVFAVDGNFVGGPTDAWAVECTRRDTANRGPFSGGGWAAKGTGEFDVNSVGTFSFGYPFTCGTMWGSASGA